MPAIVNGSEIYLTGFVGDALLGDGFTTGEVVSALAKLGKKDLTLRINSGGGIATEGAAIHAALRQHKGKVTIKVEGIAASAASLIAMAGEEIEVAPGAVLMIHDPATVTFGNADEHEKTIEALNALGNSYAEIYAARSGLKPEKTRAMMREETWLTGRDAVELGFATRASVSGEPVEPTAFAYSMYEHPPHSLVALAQARGWTPRALLQRKDFTMEAAKKQKPQDDEPDIASVPETQVLEEKPQVVETTLDEDQKETNKRTTPPETGDPGVDDVLAYAEEVIGLCKVGNIPPNALLAARAPLEAVRARIGEAAAIRAQVTRAKTLCAAVDPEVGERAIRDGKSLKEATDALLEEIVAKQSAEITSTAAPKEEEKAAIDQKTAKQGWDRAVAKQNARVANRAP